MRRRPNTLLPIEVSLLQCALARATAGEAEFHGYAIARDLRDAEGAKQLTGHGTLYRALDRMLAAGLLESRWEDPEAAAQEERPRRRLYWLSAQGRRVAEASRGVTGAFEMKISAAGAS